MNETTSQWLNHLDPWPSDPLSFANLLKPASRKLCETLRSQPSTDAVFALIDGSGRIEDIASLAQSAETATLVIGRHADADLRGSDPQFPLRQLVAVRRPMASNVVEIIELGKGRIALELPFIVRCGAYTLFAARPSDATHPAELLERAMQPRTASLPIATQTPELSVSFDWGDETTAHDIYGAREQHTLSATALSRGVLIGRRESCELPRRKGNEDESSLSRVHAYVFAVDDRAYIVDTASVHGVTHKNLGSIRHKRIEAGDEFSLGDLRMRVHR